MEERKPYNEMLILALKSPARSINWYLYVSVPCKSNAYLLILIEKS